ncbi:selenide, water dikinase SelD [Sabulicella glaciei]|uniref:Selenide, water dikinase SelD n=1 Tax=Sabulicella glaciei TaxID=2984948 RepID=A0ABT3NRJ8_9PROT|nr:selenide, water dikinase SelD [Roseococcus sp. MDT2-1-1]MCW8084784.1 selenide, water dikinase SelD [Roseococcus sp. MDT2-1-1]
MIRYDVVLVGAGAAHLVALRRFAMRPLPSFARLSLIVPEAEQPYSGAVPAVMAGRWRRDEAMLDLARLARSAGARLILAEATGLDRVAREVALCGRPPLRWDVLSLCPGAPPATVPGAEENALPLKPLGRLLEGWEAALRPGLEVVVAGGGAAGVEAAMAARARLGEGASVTLVSPGRPLGTRLIEATLRRAGIRHLDGRASRVEPGRLMLEDGASLAFGLCLWAAGAAPPEWLASSGLQRDAKGWFRAAPDLRALGEARIFLAGDVASVEGAKRPRNGVFSVRQGVPLAENIRAVVENRPTKPFRPQRRSLALLQAGDEAIATWGGFAVRGQWALRWKDRIDRAWIDSFRRLPPAPMPPTAAPIAMRCEGCGAKLAPAVLRGALSRLGGLPAGPAEDAATLPPLRGEAVQSVDLFRPPVEDPWLAGRIAAAHALGDLAAMGAEPRAALALVALPDAAPAVQEGDLFQLLHGARSVLGPAGAALLGGHSAEAAQPMIGFSVTGDAPEGATLRRGALRPGDALLLTRRLGTGAVMAAAMVGQARGADLAACWTQMGSDPMPAARILRNHGATAAADVTGFGLLGHLGEMLAASGCGAVVDPSAPLALPGALEALRDSIRSTLHGANEAALAQVDGEAAPEHLALMLDPQTSGGLLAGLPAERAKRCVDALRVAGVDACIIGHAVASVPRIRLQPGAASARCRRDELFDRNRAADPGGPLPASAR